MGAHLSQPCEHVENGAPQIEIRTAWNRIASQMVTEERLSADCHLSCHQKEVQFFTWRPDLRSEKMHQDKS